MKRFSGSRSGRAPRTCARQRAQLLAALERSGLSGAEFARRQGIGYSTLCAWRGQARTRPAPAFVQVEVTPSRAGGELVLELGGLVRLRLASPAQAALAAQLLRLLLAPA